MTDTTTPQAEKDPQASRSCRRKGHGRILVGALALLGVVAVSATAFADGWRHGKKGWGHDGDCHASRMESAFAGGGWRGPMNRTELDADQIRTLTSARLIRRGNENLKLGEVTMTDRQTFKVTIVTRDGSLVREMELNKYGFPVSGR